MRTVTVPDTLMGDWEVKRGTTHAMADQDWYYAAGGQQIGPMTFDALRELVQKNTVHRDDLVWTADMADWKPAASIPALWPQQAAAPAIPSGAVPPPPPVYRPQGSTTGAQTSGLAIASLVLGVLSYFSFWCFVSVPGIICGHMAKSQIRKHPEQYAGNEIATIALVLNYLNLLLAIAIFIFVMMMVASEARWN